jgi:hypothetical protein
MGQQQMMLIVLGVIIVGVGIAVGISQFGSDSVSANKDALINDINNLGINAYQFKILPTSMGGGSGSYARYTIPVKLRANEDGSFRIVNASTTRLTLEATSALSYGTITVVCDSLGALGNFTYTGQFQ